MRIGFCVAGASFVPQMADKPQDIRPVDALKRDIKILEDCGYDFAELTVGSIVNLSDDEFNELLSFSKETDIHIDVFNSFIPPHLPLAGPLKNENALKIYIDLAFGRMSALEGRMVILGSGAARRIPKGTSMSDGMKDIEDFLTLCSEYTQKYNMILAIEPLNSGETNVIFTVSDAAALTKKLNLPNMAVLADSYHMDLEGEDFDVMTEHSKLLVHVHLSDKDRKIPGITASDGIDFPRIMKILKDSGYKGAVSFECPSDNLYADAQMALKYIKSL